MPGCAVDLSYLYSVDRFGLSVGLLRFAYCRCCSTPTATLRRLRKNFHGFLTSYKKYRFGLLASYTITRKSAWPLACLYSRGYVSSTKGQTMKLYKMAVSGFVMAVGFTFVGCSSTSKSPDVSDSIRKSLDQPNLKDVSVSQDRDKGVVTLGGHVATESDKAQAEAIARPIAGGEVVSNQIAVIPPGAESEAKTIHSDLDKAIGKNLDAAL